MVILGLGWGGNEEARRNCQAFREELEGGGSGCPQVRSIDRRMNAGGDSRPQEDPCVRNTEPATTVAPPSCDGAEEYREARRKVGSFNRL